MRLRLSNSQYNDNNMLKMKRQSLGQAKYKERILQENYNKINTNRPAQAISFSGSAVSAAQKVGNKFLENEPLNKLIYKINDNEAAFNAIYSLIIAGMLKPGLVLTQTGFNDKDGQMIATKNFLQSFVGFFLGMTIGGGFVKKIWDTMANDLSLINVVKKGEEIVLKEKSTDSKEAKAIAAKLISKQKSGFLSKLSKAKEGMASAQGFGKKISSFFKGFKKIEYTPTEEEVTQKAIEIVGNLKKRLPIFSKNNSTKAFTAKIVNNLKELTANPSSARENLKGLRSQPYDAFESFWKRSTDIATVLTKAKISSILLPAAVAAIFAKRNAEAQILKEQKNTAALAMTKSKEKYKNFEIVTSPNRNSNISFKGSFVDKAINSSTGFFEKLAVSKGGQGCVNSLSKFSEKPSHVMSHLESFGITFYWLFNTHFSKKIDPDQKLGLNVHTALVTLISSLTSFGIDNFSDKLIKKAETSYITKITNAVKNTKEALPNASEKEIAQKVAENCKKLFMSGDIANKLGKEGILSNEKELKSTIEGLACRYSKNLSKAKSLLIFTFVVRFLVPVLTVKQSKKIKKRLVAFSKERAQKNTNNKTKKTA